MSPRQRWAILGSLFAATVGAALQVEDDELAMPAVEAATRKPPAKADAVPEVVLLAGHGPSDGEAEEPAESAIDPFRHKTWYVAPPPPPPPRPKAPPLPFQYLGQLHEDGELRVFVNHQGRHLVIQAGDVIGGTYAVETVAAGQVVFVYLPLKEKQHLPTGTLVQAALQ